MHVDSANERQNKPAFFAAAVCALICFLIFQLVLPCDVLQWFFSGVPSIGNIAAYVITLFLFVAAFCAFFAIFRSVGMRRLGGFLEYQLMPKAYRAVFVAAGAVVLFMLMLRRIVTERTEIGLDVLDITFYQLPVWGAFLVFFALAAFSVVFSLKLKDSWDMKKWFLYVGGAVVVAASFMSGLVMNIFHADIHHGVAYVESVYNVYYGMPYTQITEGIYGYFGLFLAPVLHIFKGSNYALMVAIALIECLVAVLCLYCASKITKDNYLRLLAMLFCCASTLSMRFTNYWQAQPHRVLWPLILTAYILSVVQKDSWRKRDILLGYCLCTAAVLWNVESGLYCGIAFAAACVVHQWQRQAWYNPKSLLDCLIHIACVVATVVAAMLIVNGYNYLCGWREWFVKDFFFPLFEKNYVSGYLEINMLVGNNAWVYVLVLFGALLLWALYMTSFVRGKNYVAVSEDEKIAPAMIAVAVLGLCGFAYYANRAAYLNLDVILQLAGIAICMVWRLTRSRMFMRAGTITDCAGKVAAYVSLVVMLMLALETVVFTGPLINRKLKSMHYDTKMYQQACDTLEETVPANTFAFGGGISMMYADLGWDTIGHYRDMSDLYIDGDIIKNVIVEDALTQDSFVVYPSTGNEEAVLAEILLREPGFHLEREAVLNGITMQYYVRSAE